MRDIGRLYKDDAGTSVMVEYILSIVIMSIFFSMVVLLMNSMINNADRIVKDQELGVVAYDISNRVSSFSQTLSANQYLSDYQTSTVSAYSEVIDLPDLVGGKPYTLTTSSSYDSGWIGTIKVSDSQNPHVNRSVSFASAYEVEAATFSSNSANLKIYYSSGKIKVGY